MSDIIRKLAETPEAKNARMAEEARKDADRKRVDAMNARSGPQTELGKQELEKLHDDRQVWDDYDARLEARHAEDARRAQQPPTPQPREPDPILDNPRRGYVDPDTPTLSDGKPKPPQFAGKPFVSDSRSGVADDWKRKMWLKDVSVRYRHQIAKDPALMEKMVQLYDSGQAERYADVAKGGDEPKMGYHSVGSTAARNITDVLDAQKAAQIGINVDNQAKQTNIARQMGVSRGVVMAMDDVQQSLAKGDRASAYAKMAMYGMDPRSFQGGYAVMAAEAEAKGKAKPVDPTAQQSFNAGLQTINGMQAGPDRIGAVKLHYTGALGQNAQAGAIDAAVQSHFQPHAQSYVNRGIGNLKPEERIELQQLIGQMPYAEFVKYVGAQDTPQLQQDFQRLTTRNATWGQFWSGVGSSINPFD